MYPILINFGPFLVPSWHAMYAIGALAAFWLFTKLARNKTPDVNLPQLSRIFSICYVAGYFGARLLSILIEEPEVMSINSIFAALGRFGPMTFYGGALASAFCGSIYAWKNRLPVGKLLDCAIPAGLLALAIGRIGCFLNGDDYGKPVEFINGQSQPFWAVTFPNLADNIPRYPVQLIESTFALLICALCVLLLGRKKRGVGIGAGIVAAIGVLGYGVARFLLEFIRDDYRGMIPWTALSTSQGISLILVITSAAFMIHSQRRI